MNDHTPQCQLVTKPFTECDCGMPGPEEAEPIPEQTPEGVIQTWTGQAVSTLAPRIDTIRFDDIAVALSRKTRFNGHVPFYSVAEHCVLGARLLPSPFKLAFLLHEVSEVYLPDIPGPLKPYVSVALPGYDAPQPWKFLEAEHATAILTALGLASILPLIDCPEVKLMDLRMLVAEARQLHPAPLISEWNAIKVEPAEVRLEACWTPETAEREFRAMFRELTNRWGDL